MRAGARYENRQRIRRMKFLRMWAVPGPRAEISCCAAGRRHRAILLCFCIAKKLMIPAMRTSQKSSAFKAVSGFPVGELHSRGLIIRDFVKKSRENLPLTRPGDFLPERSEAAGFPPQAVPGSGWWFPSCRCCRPTALALVSGWSGSRCPWAVWSGLASG